MGRVGAYLQLVRPGNAALAGLGVLVGAVGTVGREIPGTQVAYAMAAAALGVAGANAINDALDAEIDRTAHPKRPIPRGLVRPSTALTIGRVLLILGVLPTVLVNHAIFTLAVFLAVSTLIYEHIAKGLGLLGHILVSVNTGALFLMGGLSTIAGPIWYIPISYGSGSTGADLAAPMMMALLAMLLNLSREIYKAAEDAPHDAGRRGTVAVRAGVPHATRLAHVLTWATMLLAVAPILLPTFGLRYAWFASPLLLLLFAVPFLGGPRRSRAALKVAMWLGLVPFVVPKLI